jgi:hypothetical protein
MPFHPNQVVSFGITHGLQDVPGLQKDSADVGIKFGEPLPQFGVPTPVVDEDVDRIEDERERGVVGEPFEQGAEFAQSEVEFVVLGEELVSEYKGKDMRRT